MRPTHRTCRLKDRPKDGLKDGLKDRLKQRQGNIGANTSETTQRFPRNTQTEVVHNVDDSVQTAGEDGPYKGRAVSATLHLFTTTYKRASVL